jgi:hypothetical protein
VSYCPVRFAPKHLLLIFVTYESPCVVAVCKCMNNNCMQRVPAKFRNAVPFCVKRLTWKNHVATKRKQLDLKTREIYWLIGKHSPLSLENKLLIYKTVLKPVWTYGIELWGCATKSNIAVIQRYQSQLPRTITKAAWYVSNQTLHSDLQIPHVRTVFRERTATHRTALDSHPNPLVEPLAHPPNNRRLKRRWTFDEIH